MSMRSIHPTYLGLIGLSAASLAAADPIAPGTYSIASVHKAGACIDIGSENVHKNDDNIHRYTCNGAIYQKWKVSPDSSRPGRYLLEYGGIGNKYWTAENFKPSADHLVFDKRKGDNVFQSWVFTDKGSGKYTISNDGNARCVDIGTLDPKEDKSNIRLNPCSGGALQLWTLQPQ